VHAPPKPNTYIIGIVLGILFPVLFILLGLCYLKNRCSPLGRWQRHNYDAAMQAEAQACAHEAAHNPPPPMALVPSQPMAPMASGCPVPLVSTAVPFHPPVQHCQPMAMCPGGVTVCPPPACPPPCPPPVPYNVYTQYSVPVAPVMPVAPVAPVMGVPAHSAQPWMHSHVAHTEYNPHETLGEAWLRRRRSVSPGRSGRPSRPKHSSSTSSSS
jgi:hypothetical protein